MQANRSIAYYIIAQIFAFSFLLPAKTSAQSVQAIKNVQVSDSLGHTGISFSRDKETTSLLVFIYDAKGNTIYLESSRNFSGYYKRFVDLKSFAPGEVQLNIIADDEKAVKKITLAK